MPQARRPTANVLSSVFKPKDEEPYGRLNPKVGEIQGLVTNMFLRDTFYRQQSGYIGSYDGSSPSDVHA